MRVGARRLSLLTFLALCWAAAPAGAENGGGFGVHDGVVDIEAISRTPGAPGTGGGGASECIWRVVISDDQTRGVFGPEGERLFSDTGRWLQKECNGKVEAVNGLFVVPEGGAFAIADLLEQARNALDPPDPVWAASPDGVAVPMVTQLPTWLWIDSGYWNGGFRARASTPSGRMWAEARAEPLSAVWQVGSSTVTCGAGTAWRAGASNSVSDCAYTFRHSTAGTTGVAMTVTVTFRVDGVTSVGEIVALGEVTRSSAPVVVRVGEIQAVGT